jgi:hypothetical protein
MGRLAVFALLLVLVFSVRVGSEEEDIAEGALAGC